MQMKRVILKRDPNGYCVAVEYDDSVGTTWQEEGEMFFDTLLSALEISREIGADNYRAWVEFFIMCGNMASYEDEMRIRWMVENTPSCLDFDWGFAPEYI